MIPSLAPLSTVLAAPRSAIRSRLRAWLRIDPDVRMLGEAPDGFAAVRLIERTHPDVAILHVDLPRLDGFGVIEALSEIRPRPAIILVAQDGGDAVRAFGAKAIDYLQIPFDVARLRCSLDRVRDRLLRHAPTHRIRAIAREPEGGRIVLQTEGRVIMVNLDELSWVKAARRQSELHVGDGVVLVDVPFGVLNRRLPRESFVRINRSVIVRRDVIREVRRKSHGDRWIVLQNGESIVLSRSRRRSVLRRL